MLPDPCHIQIHEEVYGEKKVEPEVIIPPDTNMVIQSNSITSVPTKEVVVDNIVHKPKPKRKSTSKKVQKPIEGEPTAKGTKRFYYIQDGEVVLLAATTAKKRNLKPATKAQVDGKPA